MAKDKIRVKLKDGVTEVKAILAHPMESGRRRDKTSGELIPEHFIKEIACLHNGNTVLTVHWVVASLPIPICRSASKGVTRAKR